MKTTRKIIPGLLLVLLCFFLSSCSNDGVYNEETNREAIRKKKLNGVLYEWLKKQVEIQ